MNRITTVSRLEAIVGRPSSAVTTKQLDHVGEEYRAVVTGSPVAGLGFSDALTGAPVNTLVGGGPGFVRVDSPRNISLAWTEGPHRPAPGGGVSFLFLLPGIGETLRLNGFVEQSGSRLGVRVEEVYVHCARCILRSGLWRHTESPDAGPDPDPAGPADPAGPLRRPEVAGFLAASPFLLLSTSDGRGSSDTSPRGDPPGFARILDGRTLAIPDRRGNRRADTFRNLLVDDRVALTALVPGRTLVLHLRGTAAVTDDPALLSQMTLTRTAPHAALIVDVEFAQLAENEALARSSIWRPQAGAGHGTAPDLIGIAARQVARPLGAAPRLTRLLVDLGYRVQLWREGYRTGRRP
ncbi:pyridoxamine 5'-phosphate oxidase family protein [Nucisporomicrobium flavum]|uniref:pyridoxamine 5'-phosphate oxidase family protein n=1 Tax=Nucisporomicrobium flavum TaxID=2785915 RepID=UPI003C2F366D